MSTEATISIIVSSINVKLILHHTANITNGKAGTDKEKLHPN